MMRRLFFFSFLLFVLVSLCPGQVKKPLTLGVIFNSSEFNLASIEDLKWIPDGSAFTFLKSEADGTNKSIYKHDIESGKETLLIDGSTLKTSAGKHIAFDSYQWIANGEKVLFTANTQKIWRRSTKAQYFIYDLKTKSLESLIKNDPFVSNAVLSPDRSKVGYVLDNNIFTYDVKTGQVQQWTEDGSYDIINGLFDWVYEEEFALTQGWLWSPDSKKIAFWRLDQSQVPSFSWVEFDPLNGEVVTIKYPKAGQKNSDVTIGVIDLASTSTTWMDVARNADFYIPRMQWIDGQHLAIQYLNRLQNKLDMLEADASTGKTRTVFSETDPDWVDVHDNLTFMDSNSFLWTSERSGYNHVYIGNLQNGNLKAVTGGKWEVAQVYGIHDGRIYFQANKENYTDLNIYSVRKDGKDLQLLTKQSGCHLAMFSPGFNYFVDAWSNVATPTRYDLFSSDGKMVRTLLANDIPAMHEYKLNPAEFRTFTTSDGVTLHTMIYKPDNFSPDKQYPVLVYGYGGPGSQIVANTWGTTDYSQKRQLWHMMLAQQGYIVFTLDNRGTGGQGKAFKDLAYGDLSKYAVGDHIQGAQYLQSLPYVDPDRIGIWGWSGGGYLTLSCMFRAGDYFKVGIAVAPVSDFRLYDTIWTERYMGLPQENKAGYNAANTMNYIDGLKGKLLIVHGTSDDNVHFQNTMQLAEKLQQKPKQFDLMVYPGLNHRLDKGNSFLHLYTMMTNYIMKNL